jgi:hypothetical protein
MYEPAIENSDEAHGPHPWQPCACDCMGPGDRESYQFHRDNYLVDLQVSIRKDSWPVAASIAQDIGPEREHLIDPSLQLRAIYNQGEKLS